MKSTTATSVKNFQGNENLNKLKNHDGSHIATYKAERKKVSESKVEAGHYYTTPASSSSSSSLNGSTTTSNNDDFWNPMNPMSPISPLNPMNS